MVETIKSLQNILPTLETCKKSVGSYCFNYKKDVGYLPQHKGIYYVYFLINNDNIDYIGISESIYSRLVNHKMTKTFQNVLLLKFDDYQDMLNAEKQLIDELDPPLNKMNDFKAYKRRLKNYE